MNPGTETTSKTANRGNVRRHSGLRVQRERSRERLRVSRSMMTGREIAAPSSWRSHMAYELLGKNFTPPDVHAKVTGKARYAEDFRADGMVFVKLLTSPMPHARVTGIDASAALAMPGVHGVLTPADITHNPPAPNETILTDEPLFVGHPILAVAADTEELASDALEEIKVTYEELPFTVDPLQSLFPGGPNARTNGNVVQGRDIRDVKWTAQD